MSLAKYKTGHAFRVLCAGYFYNYCIRFLTRIFYNTRNNNEEKLLAENNRG